MRCPLCDTTNARDTVHRLAQKLQELAGNSSLSTAPSDLSTLFEGTAVPSDGPTDLLVRGLVYEWLIKAGLRYRICVSQTPTPQYELVPAQQTEDGRSGGQVRSAIVERASCFINERYADPLSNLAIARHVGCSVSYLARAFRQQHGVTPCQQLRQVRARWCRASGGVGSQDGRDIATGGLPRHSQFLRRRAVPDREDPRRRSGEPPRLR